MLPAEEACGGGVPWWRAAQCWAGWGVPGSAVPANSVGMTIFSSRCGLSDGGLNSFVGNFARQSPSPWPTGGLFTPRDKPDCPVIDRRSWKAINQIN